jgi:hypothetical protein
VWAAVSGLVCLLLFAGVVVGCYFVGGSGVDLFFLGLAATAVNALLLIYGSRQTSRAFNPEAAAEREQHWKVRARERAGTKSELIWAWVACLSYAFIATTAYFSDSTPSIWNGVGVGIIIGSAFLALRATWQWRRRQQATKHQPPSPEPQRSDAP